MKIEIVDLTEKNLKDTPEWESPPFSCRYCIYWEFAVGFIEPAKEKNDIMKKKLRWLKNTREVFGSCGKILYVNRKPSGYAQYAPSTLLPNSANYPSLPSNDAVLIACLFIVNKDLRRRGLGSYLLKSIIDDLRIRRVKAAETFARKGSPENPSGPVEFYLRNGFRIYKDDLEFPLMRLDL